MYASNAGDSRTVSSVGGRALCLTTDHKPGDERERKRIEDAGGFVEFNRVNGNLALSRALGDFAFKVERNMRFLRNRVISVTGCFTFFRTMTICPPRIRLEI